MSYMQYSLFISARFFGLATILQDCDNLHVALHDNKVVKEQCLLTCDIVWFGRWY